MRIKRCSKCKKELPLVEFHKKLNSLNSICKKCVKERDRQQYLRKRETLKKQALDYHHSKRGLIVSIYSNQKASSKKRGHDMPTYSREELEAWCYAQDKFHVMFKEWEDSGYKQHLAPSIDRKEDCEGYSFENIQLMIWQKNNIKGAHDIERKGAKKVIATNIQTNIETKHLSIRKAENKLNIDRANISRCCHNRQKQINGYKFRFKQ